jgi:hypothetical protein
MERLRGVKHGRPPSLVRTRVQPAGGTLKCGKSHRAKHRNQSPRAGSSCTLRARSIHARTGLCRCNVGLTRALKPFTPFLFGFRYTCPASSLFLPPTTSRRAGVGPQTSRPDWGPFIQFPAGGGAPGGCCGPDPRHGSPVALVAPLGGQERGLSSHNLPGRPQRRLSQEQSLEFARLLVDVPCDLWSRGWKLSPP